MSEKPVLAKLIDTTTCIGCKACEIACQEWNDQEFTTTGLGGDYQTQPDVTYNFWNLIKFNEESHDDQMSWLMAKYQCMHCADPGCLKACPAQGAIVVLDNGIVDFNQDKCIGCGYCITGCPFDIPRLNPQTNKVYKCTLCSDRTEVGLEPACIKVCPTSCLTFGTRSDLLQKAKDRSQELQDDGIKTAGVYNPSGVGGTNVMYVLAQADRPEAYGLPKDPKIPWAVWFWKGPLKWLGNLILIGGILGSFVHYLRYGPKICQDEND